MSVLNILATSHGTDSSEGRQAIALVRAELQKLLHERSTSDGREYKVHEAYVDVQTPSVDEAAQALPDGEPCVIVPVLLSTGFHTQVDLRRVARTSGVKDIHIAASLGPDARLAHLQRTRLEEVGWHEKIATGSAAPPIVQGAAGSSRQDGRADMQRAADLLAEVLHTPTRNAFIAAIEPTIIDIARQEQPRFASPYLLADGFFAKKMRRDIEAVSASTIVAAPLVSSHDIASARIIAQCALSRLDEALVAATE